MNTTDSDNKRQIFLPRAADYARIESGAVMRIILPAVVLIVLASGVGAVCDARWLIVGLMLLFIVVPMAILLLWLRLTGRTDIRIRLRPQMWNVSREGVRIAVYSFAEGQTAASAEIIIPADSISDFSHRGGVHILRTSVPGAPVLIAPDEHLDPESIKILYDLSYRNLRSKNAEDEDLA